MEFNIKDHYKFLVWGDSISKGVIYNEIKGKYTLLDNNYVSLVQNYLKGMVYNAAKFGNTIKKGIDRLNKEIKALQPDIVLIEFGGNDCDFDWKQIADNPLADHQPRTEFELFKETLRDTIYSLKNQAITPILMSLPPLDADRYFKWISNNSSAVGSRILTWLGSVTKIYWWQERYNSVVVSIAEETRTRLIDVRSAFLQTPDFTKLLCVDGIHPNEEGHRLIAQKVMHYIRTNYSFLLKDK